MKINLSKIKQKKSISELLEFGIINIDKPSGPTSFSVSDFVREKLEKFGVKKTSHFGTLDPKVTGVLPIALNRACKLTGFFLGEDKEYVGIMRIHEDKTLAELQKIINEKFLGKISQKPPVKSRVKREFREREIKKFELLEKDGKDILFSTEVQGGTYIRKLIDDFGREIGGAHMLELRRIRAGIFSEGSSISLYDFEKFCDDEKKLREIIIPAEAVSQAYEVVFIKRESMHRAFNGSPIYIEDLVKKKSLETGKIICIFSREDFIGMYKVINEGRMIAKAEFVLRKKD